ncbi:MAG: SLC13 family permease [Puniceicoccaceae bacterium]
MASFRRLCGLLIGVSALFVFPFLGLEGLSPAGKITLGIFVMAAAFWIFEPIPIFATSVLIILLQVFLLSQEGLLTSYLQGSDGYQPQSYKDFYNTLASPIIILFLGGFSLAAAAVKYGLDRNLTRVLLRPFGNRPSMVALGLMVSTATLSAFMSNTATTAMMVTVILPIVARLDPADPFRKAVALSIPIAANIGGIATPIGTPPNAIALGALREQGIQIAFSTWMFLALPLVVVTLFLSWKVLLKVFPPSTESVEIEIDSRLNLSGPAIASYFVFAITIILWITEKLHGISSSLVAFIPIALLPALMILDKNDIRGFSWEVLWLVAGGISLGLSLTHTGLAEWIIQLVDWQSLGGVGLIIVFAIVGFSIANLVSHTVSATILIPLAIGIGLSGVGGSGFDLTVAIIVIAIIVSYSMMLPISTPPNAIAMSTGMISSSEMAKMGLIVGGIGFLGTLLFGFVVWPLLV